MQIGFVNSGVPQMALASDAFKRHGFDVIEAPSLDCNYVAVWGWRRGQEYRAKGYEVLVFERAYLGDRFYYTSIGWNGLNGHADFKLVGDEPLKGGFECQPWHDGDYIVIMGQVAGDMSLKGQNLTQEYERWAKEAAAHYNLPVYFRPHPHTQRANFKPKIEHIGGDLKDVLANAHLVMCYNSNASVDAVLAGTPCVTFDRGSMAYDVTSHKICDRIKPSRDKWLAMVSNCQWTPQEIQDGDFIGGLFS